MTTLYKKANNGKISFWRAVAGIDGWTAEWGYMEDGEDNYQEHFEEVLEGKQGRDVDEQIESRIQSKTNLKKDAGFVESYEEAERTTPTNMLNLKRPMLAVRYDRIPSFAMIGCGVQYKYDGHRCLINRDSRGDYTAYSRNGKPITTIGHIIQDLKLPLNTTIDGELYHHGSPLQTISSWVKKSQFNSKKLKYHIYDLISGGVYADRFHILISIIEPTENLSVVPTWFDKGHEDIPKFLKVARKEGYEGLIIRRNISGYEDGKRAKQLVKVKHFEDDEFLVVGIAESKDGWAKLTCRAKNGLTFGVSAPGSISEKMMVLNNPDVYLLRKVKVEYANLTKDGIPFHPVATMWRDKEDE